MSNFITLLGAVVAAAFASAATTTLVSWSFVMAPFSFFVALGYAAILGVPAYLLLRQTIPISWWLAAVFGFACGALTVVTLEGANYPLVGFFGSVGVAGGLGFWSVMRRADAP